MTSANQIRVIPIYGWGWVIDGKPSMDVPKPFSLILDELTDVAVVLDRGHAFEGRRVVLTPRHAEKDGQFNIEVLSHESGGQSATGFGIVGHERDGGR